MEIQIKNQKFTLPCSVVKNELELYSNKYWKLWLLEVKYPNCLQQSIVICSPKDEKGNMIEVEYAFKSMILAKRFCDHYRVHHSIDFWQKQITLLNQLSIVMYNCYMSRIQLVAR